MQKSKQKALTVLINALLLGLLFVLRYTELAVLNIGQAIPITLIPFVVAIAFFYGEWIGCAVGFTAGALMDSAVVGATCFNTLALMTVGLLCGLLSTYFLNKNIKTALCLSFGSALFYFVLRYFAFFLLKGIRIGMPTVYAHTIPSILYTTVFIIPFYFLQKALKKL